MFCDILKQLRKRHKMTQEELSNALGVTRSAVSMYELGVRTPDYGMMKSISNLFNVSMDYLYEKPVPTPDGLSLSEGEQLLLDMFRQIPPEQQKVFLEMGRVYANSLKKD